MTAKAEQKGGPDPAQSAADDAAISQGLREDLKGYGLGGEDKLDFRQFVQYLQTRIRALTHILDFALDKGEEEELRLMFVEIDRDADGKVTT